MKWLKEAEAENENSELQEVSYLSEYNIQGNEKEVDAQIRKWFADQKSKAYWFYITDQAWYSFNYNGQLTILTMLEYFKSKGVDFEYGVIAKDFDDFVKQTGYWVPVD